MYYDSVILSDNPIAYYQLDETSGSVVSDSTTNHNDGAYHQAPGGGFMYAQTGLFTNDDQGCPYFSGATSGLDDYLTIPTNLFVINNDAFSLSVECWFKTSSLNGCIMANWNYPSSSDGLFLTLGDNSDAFLNNTGYPSIEVIQGSARVEGYHWPTNICDGNIHHLVFTRNGTTKVWTCYVDGAVLGGKVTDQTNIISGALTWTVSQIVAEQPTEALPFVGNMERWAFYNYALTAEQVATHYKAASKFTGQAQSYYDTVVLADTPYLYWKLDDGGRNIGTADSSGNNRNGAWGLTSYTSPEGVSFLQPGILPADSSDTSMQLVSSSATPHDIPIWQTTYSWNGDISFECWIETVGLGSAGSRSGGCAALMDVGLTLTPFLTCGFGKLYDDPGTMLDNGCLSVAAGTSGLTSSYFYQDTTTPVDDGKLHHLVWTYRNSDTKWRFYVDGRIIFTSPATSFTLPLSLPNFAIMIQRSASTTTFRGYMEKVALYQSELSAAQVLNHYNAGMTVRQAVYPSSDVDSGAWLPDSGSTLYTQINETVPVDSNYIYATAS